ncbi:Arabinose operon regulatory protein [Ascidiaceihabitans donghaensis]|uniref:Arabinose operon regulatory protein n=1 Tax=Ascidiaceihabitans donghaensis TaxID=1510460 RepID=A0A2R8BIE9_9RHOB|nr:AraC family transcriptional regulator [Ascidiaceihabitans donghaensis]SPH22802.1 Arabinose operon regulatory protein [Ascidiaceihabitans donghaensis]
MNDLVNETVAIATLAIALFGVAFCLMQRHFKRTYRSFALWLCVIALNNIPSAFVRLLDATQIPQTHMLLVVLNLASALCFTPFLWFYVFTLTSTSQSRPNRLFAHMLLPLLAVIAGLAVAWLPADLQAGVFDDDLILSLGWPVVFIVVIGLLELAIHVQIAVYLFWIIRRLVQYRQRLKDVYASTEQTELNWIFMIGTLALLFWVAQILDLNNVLGLWPNALPTAFFSVLGLAVFLTITLWGLRQQPGLVPDTPQGQADSGEDAKYEKSALSPEASARIARKLKVAMEVDHLHNNPNLSLWDLARHVGASPNYISQTLNEALGENFFDFVNRHRIKDAMHLLVQTNEPIQSITYDVGFNARSSFYTAFKKVTGQTPSAYRKSNPRGLQPQEGNTSTIH